MDEELDKTTVEVWYKPFDKMEISRIESELNLPFMNNNGEYQDVTTGSIVKEPKDIKLKESQTFFVYRVAVGRALVMKRSVLDANEAQNNNARTALHPEYDSIYI